MIKKFRYIIAAVAICCLIIVPASAFGYSTSEQFQNSVNDLNNRLNLNRQMQQEIDSQMDELDENKQYTEKEKDQAEEHWGLVKAEMDEMRPQLEEAIKNNYIPFLTYDFMNNIVGNEALSDFLFHWSFFMPFASEEQKAVYDKIQYFNDEYNDYREIVDQANYNNEKLEIAKSDKARLMHEEAQLKDELASANVALQKYLELEAKCGEAAASFIAGHGYFAHPCPEGTISSPFGEPRDNGFHKGIDFAAAEGTPIYCATDGVVVEANNSDPDSGGRGLYVKVQHSDGLVTIYMHCFTLHVNAGDHVSKGQNIARVGNTGDSTGSHVHFQTELNGEPVDGMKYLEG